MRPKEFLARWKGGMQQITPLQQTKVQILSTAIVLIGIVAGLIISIINGKNLWWLGLILGGALINTGLQFIALLQRKKMLISIEQVSEEAKVPNYI